MRHPKEYVKNLYPAVEVAEQLLPYTIEMYGCDNLILGSDYPHPDTFFPHTIPSLMALESISDEAKEKSLAATRGGYSAFEVSGRGFRVEQSPEFET